MEKPKHEQALARHFLPELLVMAGARHAVELATMHEGLGLCGHAKTWEDCVTLDEMENGLQLMLWYNVGKGTHGVAVMLPDQVLEEVGYAQA